MPSVYFIIPKTDSCRTWLQENTDGTWFGGGLAVEHRYIDDLATGMQEAGFGKDDFEVTS